MDLGYDISPGALCGTNEADVIASCDISPLSRDGQS
jgi:hypothetical protein